MDFKNCRLNQFCNIDCIIEPKLYYHQSFSKSFSMNQHRHASIECMYASKKGFTVEFYDETGNLKNRVNVKQGMLIIINTLVPHALVIPDDFVGIKNIEFRAEPLNDNNGFFVSPAIMANESEVFKSFIESDWDYIILSDDGEIDSIFSKIHKEMWEVQRKPKNEVGTEKLILQLLTAEFFLECSRHFYKDSSVAGNFYIEKAESYIRKNLDTELRISDIAEHLHISMGYLEQVFKAKLGVSVINYINQQRTSSAIVFLTQTSLSIADIGFRVGYNNRQTFIRVFKKNTGMTPAKYRANMKQLAMKNYYDDDPQIIEEYIRDIEVNDESAQ